MPPETEGIQTESPTITPDAAVQSVAALRDKIAAVAPNIVPELLKADSMEALISSIDESRAAYDRIVAAATPPSTGETAAPAPVQVEAATAEKPTPPEVPAGAGTYTDDINKLPAHELIRRGLLARDKSIAANNAAT